MAKAQNFQQFMRKNQRKPVNITVPATRSLVDENGKPLDWEIRAITVREETRINQECLKTGTDKDGKPTVKFDQALYMFKFAAACTVFPDLYNKELQDSYGVMTPEDLIANMIYNSEEFTTYYEKCKAHSGMDTKFEDEVQEAKN